MPRSNEVTRQWQVLRALAASRLGLTVEGLATDQAVTPRTIRRDLAALERAGFPLLQETEANPYRWRLDPAALGGLDAGFSLIELCALYFSRATLECLAGAPFHDELSRAFSRFERGLTPGMRQFLDRLPVVVGAKQTPGGKRSLRTQRDRVTQLLEASLQRRVARMRYHSVASRRTKDYEVHASQVVYADGGLYLRAFVPAYGETRTFAVERIERLSLTDERFELPAESASPFAHSLGVNSGPPQLVELDVHEDLVPVLTEREWHASQSVRRIEGRWRVEMQVCIDWSLRRWILGFGPQVRVVSPASLADDILDMLDAARANYAPRFELDGDRPASPHAWDLTRQRALPFVEMQRLIVA
jgi:predicted DNA-binding transcriptional regulator YafY